MSVQPGGRFGGEHQLANVPGSNMAEGRQPLVHGGNSPSHHVVSVSEVAAKVKAKVIATAIDEHLGQRDEDVTA